MTTVATRVRAISDLEGFDIIVRQNGQEVDKKANGTLGSYPYEKRAKHNQTVAEWKQNRFEATYQGFTCDVLKGDGAIATGQTRIETVRQSYEEDAD
jgi:hypothetical protein